MAADAVPRRRQNRFVTALILVAGVVAAAFALVRFLAGRPHAEAPPGPGSARVPSLPEPRPGTPTAEIPDTADDSAGTDPDHEDHEDSEDSDSLEDWTVARLRMRARELGITGYSRMRKAELVAALRDAAG
ncbi:MAG: hypothetical protein EOL89_09780 [Actinobacteria bacterium]|nr:hypothetical protein [Actinomycetota bacterium]